MRSVLLAAAIALAAAAAAGCGEDERSGLDVSALDRSADPCTDFYQFACGGWIAAHPIRGDSVRAARFDEAFGKAVPHMQALVDGASRTSSDEVERSIAAYRDACNAAPGSTGARAQLRALVESIDAVTTLDALARQMAAQRALGSGTFFSFGVEIDPGDTTRRIAYLGQGGVELGDRKYYLDADQSSVRDEYRTHIVDLSTMVLGAPLDAEVILRVETALATAYVPPDERREPASSYHPLDIPAVSALLPSFPLAIFLSEAGYGDVQTIDVHGPDYLRALELLFSTTSIAELVTYMKWQLLQDRAKHLDQQVLDTDFAFWRIFSGRTALPPVSWTCFLNTLNLFEGEVAQKYVGQYFDESANASTTELAEELRTAFSTRLDRADWLDQFTRMEAQAKLQQVRFHLGHPTAWPETVPLEPASYFEMYNAALQNAQARAKARLMKPVDPDAWTSPVLMNNATYGDLTNTVTVGALMINSPFLDGAASKAHNLGALGAVLGHELSHGFDDLGRHFDGSGKLRDWWTSDAGQSFVTRAQCLVDQFTAFEALPGQHVNGNLTLGENIADLGGVTTAYHALTDRGDPGGGGDGFDARQVFFLAYAQMWCESARPEWTTSLLLTDSHAPARARVNATLSNLSELSEAFACRPGSAMVSASPCTVW